jgi:hypothetical protein
MLRQYEPIWIQIKSEGYCDISTHRAYHRRVIKAVTKEKDKDLGYKLECTERYPPVQAILKSTRSGSVIKFILILKPLITIDSI